MSGVALGKVAEFALLFALLFDLALGKSLGKSLGMAVVSLSCSLFAPGKT
jgi:hypothetical protein